MRRILMPRPRKRYGWSGKTSPHDYGSAYAMVDVVPGDRVEILHSGEAVVYDWDDPDVKMAMEHCDDPPKFDDGYVYARAHDGLIDGWPAYMLTKKF
jgi:hypothetical protein